MKKITFFTLILLFVLGSFFSLNLSEAYATSLGFQLKGKILLQVEENGEAWYVNPENEKRYYMGRPDDAFQLMRELGLGITNDDLYKIKIGQLDGQTLPEAAGSLNHWTNYTLSRQLAGKILLQVEENGEAWYVNPNDLKRYYLGRPADAFNIMRSFGLGITNCDLSTIEAYGQVDEFASLSENLEFKGLDSIIEEEQMDLIISEFEEAFANLSEEVNVEQVLIDDVDYHKFNTDVSSINYFVSSDAFDDVSEYDLELAQGAIYLLDSMFPIILPEVGFAEDENIDFYVDNTTEEITVDFTNYGVDLLFTEESSEQFSTLMQRMEDDYNFGEDEYLELFNEMSQAIITGNQLNEEIIMAITDEIYGADTSVAYEDLNITF